MPTVPIQIKLGGHPPTFGTLVATSRPRSQRVIRAVVTLSFFLALGAAVVFIPPHIPWALGALTAGIFFSHREWRSEYSVEGISGACPRCGSALSVKRGETIGLPMKLTCFNCHHEPVLTLGQ